MGSDGECNPKLKIDSTSRDEAIDKGQLGNSEVLQIPVHVAEADVLGGARQILSVLRPTWSSADIQFKVGCAIRAVLSTLLIASEDPVDSTNSD